MEPIFDYQSAHKWCQDNPNKSKVANATFIRRSILGYSIVLDNKIIIQYRRGGEINLFARGDRSNILKNRLNHFQNRVYITSRKGEWWVESLPVGRGFEREMVFEDGIRLLKDGSISNPSREQRLIERFCSIGFSIQSAVHLSQIIEREPEWFRSEVDEIFNPPRMWGSEGKEQGNERQC